MHKWRPSFRAIYVIPEVHGNIDSLNRILDRILPLRSHTGQEDTLIFLGDYVDKGEQGADVIETLISIKKEYGERVICLRGNHDDLFAQAISGSKYNFDDWIAIGGQATIGGYLTEFGIDKTIEQISSVELKEIVPKEHIDFLSSLESYHILGEYFFMHGSFNVAKTIAENDLRSFIYDISGSKYVKECLKKKSIPELKDEYIFVGAHNYNGKTPFIYQKYMMLGGGAPEKLFVWDLNSMQCCRVLKGKKRIYPYKFDYCE